VKSKDSARLRELAVVCLLVAAGVVLTIAALARLGHRRSCSLIAQQRRANLSGAPTRLGTVGQEVAAAKGETPKLNYLCKHILRQEPKNFEAVVELIVAHPTKI
jgi:hypothetical protein